MPKTLKIEIASAFVLVGFFAAVVFHYVMNFYFNAHYPLNTFLQDPRALPFSGFFSDYAVSKNLSPYDGLNLALDFPTTYLFFYPFTWLAKNWACLLYAAIFLIIMLGSCRVYFSCEHRLNILDPRENAVASFKNIFLLALMTFPVLFAFEKGSIEVIVFLFLVLSLFLYERKKFFLSAIVLSLPISMKLTPAVFLVLFLSDKRFKEVFVCLIGAALFTCASCLLLKGSMDVMFQGFFNHLSVFRSEMMSQHTGLAFDLSYYSLLETKHRIYHHIPWEKAVFPTRVGLRNYAVIMISLFACLSLHIIFGEKIFWKKVALLVISMLLFPYISFDEKLLYIYLPLFLFMNERPSKKSMDLIYLVIFSLLLIPKNYARIYGQVSINDITNIFLLTFMMVTILLERFLAARQ